MRHHQRTASALLETPYFDVPREDTIPRSRAWTSEQRLMGAVLDDAVRTWRQSATLPGRRAARLRNELHDWLVSDATDQPFSFVNVCEHLGLSAESTRAHLHLAHATDQAA
jgi:hypothetical protein